MKKIKNLSKISKLLLVGLVVILICTLASGAYFYYKLSSITDKNEIQSLEKTNDYKVVDGITNILLIGVDARNLEEQSRSDAMMIVTVDNNSKVVKMTSLARDTYVDIPGHGMEKLTHAYAYGGISLLLETIESNFELDINHYSIVNFNSFIDIIDAIGGIEVNIQKKDIKELNKIIKDSYKFTSDKDNEEVKLIKSEGIQELNGYQALAYSRIRKHDSAFNRDERQREVLESLIAKLKSLPITRYNSLLNSILPNIKTDMVPKDILDLGFTILSVTNLDIKKLEFPLLDYSDGRIRGNDGWVLDFKRELCLKVLHDFIFENIIYSKEELIELDKTIESTYNSKYNNSLKDNDKDTTKDNVSDNNKKDNINDNLEDEYDFNSDYIDNNYNNSEDDFDNNFDSDYDNNIYDNIDDNNIYDNIDDNFDDFIFNEDNNSEPSFPTEPNQPTEPTE